ncbi:MAG: hypothetical protein WC897_02115 [Candidatus Gracilibacteria bacterium]
MRKLLSLIILSSLALIACGGTNSQAENAGKAMAETACLLFDDATDMENIETLTTDIMVKYGWSTPADIDTYLAQIQGTEELNQVSVATRTHLEDTCGDSLTANGVTATDLAEAMVTQ